MLQRQAAPPATVKQHMAAIRMMFARIGAIVNLKSKIIIRPGNGFCSGLKKRAGKKRSFHHKLEELLDEYLQATGLGVEPVSLLFPAALRNTGKLSRRPLRRTDAADMLKRRLKQAGLPAHYSPHSFRATGSTNWKMTAPLRPFNESPTTPTAGPLSFMTELYDRRGQKVFLEDMERILY
jgi:integrase